MEHIIDCIGLLNDIDDRPKIKNRFREWDGVSDFIVKSEAEIKKDHKDVASTLIREGGKLLGKPISKDYINIKTLFRCNDRTPYEIVGCVDECTVRMCMLKLSPDNNPRKEVKNLEVKQNAPHCIIVEDKDPEIIKEMIDKVDRESFISLVKLGARNKNVSEDVVNWYLEQWAINKYEFYLLFGRNFKISDTIEIDISKKEMEKMLNNLFEQDVVYKNNADGKVAVNTEHYKIYKLFTDNIPIEDFINNRCSKNEMLEKYCTYYKPGMKLSKFFSTYFKDTNFDIDLSKVMQNKKLKGEMSISIDPIDYLTSAINKNNWSTCQSIYSGCHACGPFSLLLDPTTLVCYKANGVIYDYCINGLKFRANSKQFRAFAYLNKKDMSFAVCRAYPDTRANNIYDGIKNLCQDKFSKALGIPNEWFTTIVTKKMDGGSCGDEYIMVGNLERHHVDKKKDYVYSVGRLLFSDPIKYVCTLDKTPIEHFRVGIKEIKCAVCGKPMTELYNGSSISCC